MIIAYQGVPGAYSEKAARALFPGCETLPCDTFEAVFAAVEKKRAVRGVIPVENSLAGSIHLNYDLLAHHALRVTGETYVRVEHALLALPGTRLAEVRTVRSHPQALAQCSDFFVAHPGVQAVTWYDTAGAARSLVEDLHASASMVVAGTKGAPNVHTVAAIASEAAAEIYGLKVLKRRLQNRAINFTRFLAIARPGAKAIGSEIPGGNGNAAMKTSMTFIPARNRAGVLHAITGLFAAQGIDLTKIESRPDPENPFDYRFHIDATGGAQDPALKKALAELKKFTRDLQVLGSYLRADLPITRKGAKSRAPRT
jgi:prephenate dehydratase